MHEKQIRTITALVADALAEQKLPFAKDRKAAGPTAPACGLYLNRVFY